MSHDWISTAPVLRDFSEVADPGRYAGIPPDWVVGVTDVVSSTVAIEAGRYKEVNLAGAGAISAVGNALNGDLHLFAFGGDGARFAVPPEHAQTAAGALSRVAMWAKRDLNLDLRVGMMKVSDVRAAGHDIRVAFWRASKHIRYAMFNGGGLEWVETKLKRGEIGLAQARDTEEPDLTGLSCLWGSIVPQNGKIASLIVKKTSEAKDQSFAETTSAIVKLLDSEGSLNPVPSAGPEVKWSPSAMALQARVAQPGRSRFRRRFWARLSTALIWAIFRYKISLPGFDPERYRSEIPANTDFRKFDDGLMMTVDCSPDTIEKLRTMLEAGAVSGVIRYGLHIQDRALMTCVVSSVFSSNHAHFVDGAEGGYAVAARQMQANARSPSHRQETDEFPRQPARPRVLPSSRKQRLAESGMPLSSGF